MLMDGKVAPVPKTERVQPQMPSRGSVDRGSDSTPLWRRTLRMSTDTQPHSNALEAFDRHSKRGEALGSQGASQPSREGLSGWRARCASVQLVHASLLSCSLCVGVCSVIYGDNAEKTLWLKL